MTAQPKTGDIVEVVFLDHCEGSDDGEPILFRVYGVVLIKAKSHYEIGSWVYDDMKRQGDRNETRYTIVRSAIRSIRTLT